MERADAHSSQEEAGEGSYLASLSDLMVGMLFIFIIMLMAFALMYGKATDTAEGQKSALQCLLVKNQRQLETLLGSVEQQFNGANLNGARVQLDSTRTVLRMEDSVLFDKGRADLQPIGEAAIGELARLLYGNLPCYMGVNAERPSSCSPSSASIIDGIYIEGHTDNDPILGGIYKDNWDLSTARATVTFRRMIAAEPNLAQLKNARSQVAFGVSGYGEQRPLNENSGEAQKKKNRRIDMRFTLRTPTQKDVEDAMRQPEEVLKGCD